MTIRMNVRQHRCPPVQMTGYGVDNLPANTDGSVACTDERKSGAYCGRNTVQIFRVLAGGANAA